MKLRSLRSTLWSAALLSPVLAVAAEGGIGRPITGQQIYSDAGIVPPTPGLVLTLTILLRSKINPLWLIIAGAVAGIAGAFG